MTGVHTRCCGAGGVGSRSSSTGGCALFGASHKLDL